MAVAQGEVATRCRHSGLYRLWFVIPSALSYSFPCFRQETTHRMSFRHSSLTFTVKVWSFMCCMFRLISLQLPVRCAGVSSGTQSVGGQQHQLLSLMLLGKCAMFLCITNEFTPDYVLLHACYYNFQLLLRLLINHWWVIGYFLVRWPNLFSLKGIWQNVTHKKMNMFAATSKLSVKSLYKCEGFEGEFAIKSLCIFLCQVHLPHLNRLYSHIAKTIKKRS